MEINVEERSKRAMEFFREGYNCCQSVILSFADVAFEKAGLSAEQLAALGSGFGGGLARQREVCGAVSGMTLIAGLVSPALPAPHSAGLDHHSAEAMATRKANYALVQSLCESYRRENGSIICRDLMGLRAGVAKESPEPSERTPEYYKARPCEQLVGSAAAILAEALI